jgi:hypothetical protein
MTRSKGATHGAALCMALACGAAPAQVVAGKDRFGDVMRIALPLAAAGLSAYEHDTQGLKELAESMVLSQGATEVLKRAVNSKRPDGTGRGFPSGHVSAAFTAATYVHERYSLEWSLPFYVLATAVAEERVRTHHHFTKDVIGGALVGSASSWFLTDRFTGPRSRVGLGFADRTLVVGYSMQW